MEYFLKNASDGERAGHEGVVGVDAFKVSARGRRKVAHSTASRKDIKAPIFYFCYSDYPKDFTWWDQVVLLKK
jgi:hypothetical protein